jgi:hypothetical protein
MPTLNEAGNLTHVFETHVFERMPQAVSEIVFVDGHSTDGTVTLAKKLSPDVVAIQQSGQARATPWHVASGPQPVTSSSCSTPTARPTQQRYPVSWQPSWPVPTSPRARAASLAGAAPTSPGSGASATGHWRRSSTGSGAASTATCATGTTPSGGAGYRSSPLTAMVSRSKRSSTSERHAVRPQGHSRLLRLGGGQGPERRASHDYDAIGQYPTTSLCHINTSHKR